MYRIDALRLANIVKKRGFGQLRRKNVSSVKSLSPNALLLHQNVSCLSHQHSFSTSQSAYNQDGIINTEQFVETPIVPNNDLNSILQIGETTVNNFSLETGDLLSTAAPLQTECLADFGLGGSYLPHHVIQYILDFIHSQAGLHWIPTLMIATVTCRLIALPAYIKMRRFVVHSNNSLPQQLKLQQEVNYANGFEKQRKAAEYMNFMHEKQINPLKPLLYQMPTMVTFMSFFAALRGMAEVSYPSLTTGGVLWFQNLTLADPYYLLPILACTSMHLIIRFGAASAEVGPAESIPWMKAVLMWSPFVILPFFFFQPSVMFIFWMTSNAFSVLQMFLFRNEAVQRYFKIPELIKHPKAVMDNFRALMVPSKIKMVRRQQEREEASKKVQRHLDQLRKFSKDKDVH